MKRTYRFLVTALLVIGFQSAQGAAFHLETSEYSTVYSEVEAKRQKYGADGVLVVFDIDNTLLVNNQDLGTDQWFEWQKALIEKKQFAHAVATTFQGLIDTQAGLYALGRMRETEPSVSDYVAKIQNQGLRTIVLTARDGNNRDSTLRELALNGLKFENSAIGPQGGFGGRYLPYDLSTLEMQVTAFEAAAWKLKAPRPVVYTEGVYLTAGQHKGAMLRLLLHKIGKTFDAIVFVDDKVKNTSDMTAGFGHLDVDLTTIRYTREDANVARFERGSKAEVIGQWETLSSAVNSIFGGMNDLIVGK